MTSRRSLTLAAFRLLAATLALPGAVHAADKPKPDAAAAAAAAEKPFQEWKKLTKDAERSAGFLTFWRKRDNLWLEISKSQLGQPFLQVTSLARGIGSNFMLGGLPVDDRMLVFERVGDRILMYEDSPRFVAPAGTPIAKAMELSIPRSVKASFKIESEHDSSKAVLVDFASYLVSDVTDIGERFRASLNNVSVRFDKERSALTSAKTFPDNTELEALLTYTPNDRTRLTVESVADDRYIPVTMHYSFCRLPEKPMMPRWADNRVGYFHEAMKDFSRDKQESFWLRPINRWRLEKKDPSAALSEPVKPIVYYLDPTIPAHFRPWVKEGVELWQKAFEEAGFKNAILAKDAPTDDPNWDAEDVRYSTIRWITSSEPAFGAIGPSRVDPRTGEIYDSDILFEASMFQNYANGYRRYAGPDALAKSILPSSVMDEIPAGMSLDHLCMAGRALEDGGALQRMAMMMDGTMAPGTPVPDEFLRGAVVWAVMHEVGHALGLRHNFRSSTSTPEEHLQDATWTRANGLYASVMEYPSPNIDYSRAKQGDWYTATPGTYDRWAIRYGYTPSGAADADADRAFARTIADESLKPGHEFSTDEDTYPPDAPDPRSNIYDLGSDPLRFAKERTTYLSALLKNPKFEERIVGSSGDLTALRRAVDTVLGQYGIASNMALKYLGGSYMSRVERGQPLERDPVVPVPAARQREAMDFLGSNVWAPTALEIPPRLLQRLAPNRWSQWGMGPGGTFASRQDYDYLAKIGAIQRVLLGATLAPSLLARMREAETRSADAYRMSEHFDRLTRTLWGEVGGAAPAAMRALEGPGTRREVQRAYVDLLGEMVTGAPTGLPDDARALARLQLQRIDARCARVLAAAAPVGDYTRSHLSETRARIGRTLNAGVDATR